MSCWWRNDYRKYLIRKNLGGKEITKLLYLITKFLSNNNKDNTHNNNKFPYELFNIKDMLLSLKK
jgi:hypothetical protein